MGFVAYPPANTGFSFISAEPPSHALGIPLAEGYLPLNDEDIPPEERIPAFAKWVSGYYTHGDLSTHDLDQLNYRNPDPSKKTSIENMTPEELFSGPSGNSTDKFRAFYGWVGIGKLL